MFAGRVRPAWISLIVVACWGLSAGAAPAAVAAGDPWCGVSTAFDWVCPRWGQVFAEQELLGRGEARVAAERKAITTAAHSEARLSFADQANCTLYESSRIYTRPEIGRSRTLFAQPWGESSCVSLRGGNSLSVLCGEGEIRCPVKVKMKQGKYLTRYSAQQTAGATASGVSRRRTTLVACTGFIRVRVETEGGFVEASGRASGDYRYVAVVEEVTATGESEGAFESASKVQLEFKGLLRGPGACDEDRLSE
jgi:hypothetical protein